MRTYDIYMMFSVFCVANIIYNFVAAIQYIWGMLWYEFQSLSVFSLMLSSCGSVKKFIPRSLVMIHGR